MVAVQNYHGNPAPPGKPVLTFQTGDVIELLRGDPDSPWWEVSPGSWREGLQPYSSSCPPTKAKARSFGDDAIEWKEGTPYHGLYHLHSDFCYVFVEAFAAQVGAHPSMETLVGPVFPASVDSQALTRLCPNHTMPHPQCSHSGQQRLTALGIIPGSCLMEGRQTWTPLSS